VVEDEEKSVLRGVDSRWRRSLARYLKRK